DDLVTGVQTCALPICPGNQEDAGARPRRRGDRADGVRAARLDEGLRRQIGGEVLRDRDGPHPGAAAAVGDAERLVQVDVHDVRRSEERRVGKEWQWWG